VDFHGTKGSPILPICIQYSLLESIRIFLNVVRKCSFKKSYDFLEFLDIFPFQHCQDFSLYHDPDSWPWPVQSADGEPDAGWRSATARRTTSRRTSRSSDSDLSRRQRVRNCCDQARNRNGRTYYRPSICRVIPKMRQLLPFEPNPQNTLEAVVEDGEGVEAVVVERVVVAGVGDAVVVGELQDQLSSSTAG
jgi:hypothetical protein